jgi:enoyl-CoA hydratase
MSEPHLLVERDGHVCTLTLNRPDARNAFGLEMMARLADAWIMVDEDPEIRAVILTGAGGTFSAGADLKTHLDRQHSPWQARFDADPDLHWRCFLRHYTLKKPLIAAVEGYALGGGTEILQATDIRVAGETARFGVTEAKMGLFPLGGSTVRLRRQIPHTKALEMLLTGEMIDAAEALRIGLVGRVVPAGQALAEATRLAQRIADNGPLAVQAILRSVKESAELSEAEGLARELEIGWPILKTRDAREGGKAFAEKRKPVFRGE